VAPDSGTDGPITHPEAGNDMAVADRGAEAQLPDLTVQPDGPKHQPGWFAVMNAALGRVDHTATLLKDGRVLVTGGWYRPGGKTTRLASAYVYVPAQDAVVAAGSMTTPRDSHTATLLPDGRVLVAGGYESYNKPTSTVEIYDPTKPAGSAWSAGPALPGLRAAQAVVTLKSSEVVLVAGWDGSQPLASLAIFQTSGSWKLPAAALNEKRSGHTASLLPSGKMLVVGGYDASQQQWLDSLELYDPVAGTITLLTAKLLEKRSGHTSTVLNNGMVLIVGGFCGGSCSISSDELYDPTTNTVKAVSHAGGSPTNQTATLLTDGTVLVAGGEGNSDAQKAVAYDSTGGGSWTILPSMNHGRHDHTASLLQDGSVLVVGGKTGSWEPITEQLERFYP